MMSGFVELAYRRRMGEHRELLQMIATGTQGTDKSIKALLRTLTEESE